MVNDDFSLVNPQATAGSARNIFNQVFIELNEGGILLCAVSRQFAPWKYVECDLMTKTC